MLPKTSYRTVVSNILRNAAVDKDEFISIDRDRAWMKEANNIEYVVGQAISFESLGAIGLNISTEISSRYVIKIYLRYYYYIIKAYVKSTIWPL